MLRTAFGRRYRKTLHEGVGKLGFNPATKFAEILKQGSCVRPNLDSMLEVVIPSAVSSAEKIHWYCTPHVVSTAQEEEVLRVPWILASVFWREEER